IGIGFFSATALFRERRGCTIYPKFQKFSGFHGGDDLKSLGFWLTISECPPVPFSIGADVYSICTAS
ncbi:hypothetical protein CYMTET_56353, partial [Cymbomonas tetramitiformis]